MSYIEPDPASGLQIYFVVGDSFADPTPEGFCTTAMELFNGRSWMAVDLCKGTIYDSTLRVQPQDKDAFDRWYAAVEVKTQQ